MLASRAHGTLSNIESDANGRQLSLLRWLLILSLFVGLAARLALNWTEPLWLDEIFTGTIALGSGTTPLMDDLLNEVGGPIYYSFMWAWEKLAGASNAALRVPSFIFAIAAPALVLWRGHEYRAVRWIWACLIVLWLPGISYAAEARSYTLLFLLSCGQTILFIRIIERPAIATVLRWSLLSGVAILTHYHSLVLVGMQALAFLAAHRAVALRTWPAGLVFIPVAGFMALHLPKNVGSAKVAWYKLLEPESAVRTLVDLLLGLRWFGAPILFVVAFGTAYHLIRRVRGIESVQYRRADMLAVGASAAALLFVYALGFIRPSFSPRYLFAYMPGILLGIALFAHANGRRWPAIPVIMVGYLLLFGIYRLGATLIREPSKFRSGYSWEMASSYLQRERVERVIFLWDNVSVLGHHQPLLARVGSFYFDRAGLSVDRDALLVQGSDERLRSALLSAASGPEAAKQTVGTLLLGRRMDMSSIDPRWRCLEYGGPDYDVDIYITACARPPLVRP